MGMPALASALVLVVFGLQAPLAHAATPVRWCDSETPGGLATRTHGDLISARLYKPACIDLCVYVSVPSPPPPSPSPPPLPVTEETADRTRRSLLQSTGGVLLSVRRTLIDESYPALDDPLFTFPFDEVNWPSTGYFDGSPASVMAKMPYCVAPITCEECVYTVCFEGIANDPSVYTPTEDVRCFRIEVLNDVLTFDGDDEAEDNDVSQKLTPADGLTFSAYVYPACTGASGFNQTVMYFGSGRNFASPATSAIDTGYEIRNGIKWSVAEGATEGAEGGVGQFFYYDCNIGAVASPAQYACDVWHYVAVTIAGSTGTLYVDGIAPGHTLPTSRDLYTYSVSTFNTTTRPDNSVDNAAMGVFKMGHYPGEGFVGSLDEVRVYNYAMSSSQVFADMVTRTRLVGEAVTEDPNSLKLYLTMTHFTELDNFVPTLSSGIATSNTSAIPTMIPCVLGLEHSVGPVDGLCTTKVYGWSFSDSVNPQCSIAGVQGQAVWNSDDQVTCSTPGHLSPRFATVLASNNGLNFTDTTCVDKTVRHLYMESSMYIQGANGGASADQVCKDFTAGSQAVTVSAWSCPKCTPPAGGDPIAVNPSSPSQESC